MVIFWIALCALFGSSFAHICNMCDCQQQNSQVFSITCDCKSSKHLHLTASMMMGVESAVMVHVQNCQIVSIERNSFFQLEKLDTLSFENCKNLYLASGTFSNLHSLLISNVDDISLGEMALMGARGMKNIIINSSNITELPKYSLYDVEELDRFSLKDVNIKRIQRNAVNISAKSIFIENINVGRLEINGLEFRAQKVIIKRSSFHNVLPNSMKIQTHFQTRFLENTFKGPLQCDIVSPFVEFFGNHFDDFYSMNLAKVQTYRMMSNVIRDGDFGMILRKSDYKDFYGNVFDCKCGMNLLNMTRHSLNYEILKKNYCAVNCTLNLLEFEGESFAKCTKDFVANAEDYCTYERKIKKPDVPVRNITDHQNVTEPKIQPRFLDLGENEIVSAAGAIHSSIMMGLFMLLFGLNS